KLPDCIYVEPEDDKNAPRLFVPSTFGQTKFLGLVTNRPSFLWVGHGVPRRAHVLARFPRGCWYGGARGQHLPRDWSPYTVAVSSEHGKGRLLLLADHSIFINEMMQPRDTGNADFAYNAVDWLREGEDGPRDRVLFVTDSRIETKLDIPLRQE